MTAPSITLNDVQMAAHSQGRGSPLWQDCALPPVRGYFVYGQGSDWFPRQRFLPSRLGRRFRASALFSADRSGCRRPVAALDVEQSKNGYKAIQLLNKTDSELSNTIAEQKATQDGVNKETASQIKQNAQSISTVVTNLGSTDVANSRRCNPYLRCPLFRHGL